MRRIVFTPASGTALTLGQPATGATAYNIEDLDGVEGAPIIEQTQKSPYMDGASYIDSLYDIRVITVVGQIMKNTFDLSGIWTARRTIIKALNPKLGLGTMAIANDNATYNFKNVIGIPTFKSKNARQADLQAFQIIFKCYDPFAYHATAETPVTPLINSTNATATNGGDVECPIVITITGACVNPIIHNITTGKTLGFVQTMVSGDTLVINTAFGAKSFVFTHSAVSINASLDLRYLDFFQLAKGDNVISFTADSGAATCSIAFTHRHVGL